MLVKILALILQTDQAEADLKVARAKAEERSAAAVALEQEILLKLLSSVQGLLKPKLKFQELWLMHFSIRKSWIMDYYDMKNIQSDTDMRNSISKPEKEKRISDH